MIYKTVKSTHTAVIYEKKSEFIANIAHVKTEIEAKVFLDTIRKKHHTANHNCFAYIIKNEKIERQSDDGEPAKTAGMPILEVIRHENLEDVIVVVTRYFGGTLLGTGGLVRAYTAAAKEAVNTAEVLTYTLCNDYFIEFDYSLFDKLKVILENNNAKILDTQFTNNIKLEFRTLKGEEENLLKEIEVLTKGMSATFKEEIFDIF